MRVYKEYGTVRIVTEGSPFEVASDVKVQVLKNEVWETVRGFNSLSDDYALTNAQNYAIQKNLQDFLEQTDEDFIPHN